MKNTIVGVDLAKDVIQVCVYTNVRSNTEMTPSDLIDFLANSKSLTIIFEACGTSVHKNKVYKCTQEHEKLMRKNDNYLEKHRDKQVIT